MPNKKVKSRSRASRGVVEAVPTSVAIAIMAAGKGTRLKSKHPKVLHEVGGKPLLAHVIAAATHVVAPEHVFVVIGHEAEQVREAVRNTGVNFVRQEPQRGTGHALMCAAPSLSAYDHVIVLSGDVPLIRPETILQTRDEHLARKAAMTVITMTPSDPAQYGRIVRKRVRGRATDEIAAIVELKALQPAQRSIREVNSGVYCFAAKPLFAHIDELTTNNPAREYYLTDMAGILRAAGERVVAMPIDDATEVLGVNSRAELAELDAALRMKKCRELMAAGVTIYRPETCMIDSSVQIAQDTIIEPFVQLRGATRIGSDCHIESYSVITDAEIGDGVHVKPACTFEGARVARNAIIGPYARLRQGTDIGEGVHIGNFVETKKARLGKGSKANHLTYLGDVDIGERTNIGAGTITCNYDGVGKYKTEIGDGVFVGSDATLVAPVKVGSGSYIGAASCITDNVPEDSLALGRARQTVKPGWAKQKRDARQS